MGTRSITTIIDNAFDNKEVLCTMYRQFDGYPSGHGKELFDFLSQFTIVNGMSMNDKRKIANGAGCLAAQMVQHFKEEAGAGGIYMVKPRTKLDGEDYGYEVTITPALDIEVTVRSYRARVFKGTLAAFGEFCSKEEE